MFERDGEQCTFEAADGTRCACRAFLELDHVVPRALGGTDTVDNLRVRCHPHDRLYAEQTCGREHVEEQIHFRQRKSRRVKHDDAPAAIELARRGLVNLGYRASEAQRAITIVRERHANDIDTLTPEAALREALAVLAS